MIPVMHVITRLTMGGSSENTVSQIEALERAGYASTLVLGPQSEPAVVEAVRRSAPDLDPVGDQVDAAERGRPGHGLGRGVLATERVDAGQEGVAIVGCGPRRAEAARIALRQLDARRGVGVTGEEVEAGVLGPVTLRNSLYAAMDCRKRLAANGS